MELIILSDNKSSKKGYLTEHGFSVLIDREYLMDAGQSRVFINNAEEAGVDLKRVKTIILSHGHYDHSDGMLNLISMGLKGMDLILHRDAFAKKYHGDKYIGVGFKKEIAEGNFNCIYAEEPLSVNENILVSAEVPRITDFENNDNGFHLEAKGVKTSDIVRDDMFVILRGNTGNYMLCGCCHSGIVNSLEYAKKINEKKISGIIGGMHLSGVSDEHLKKVDEYLKEAGINKIFLSHCSGDNAVKYFEENGYNVIVTGAGDVINI